VEAATAPAACPRLLARTLSSDAEVQPLGDSGKIERMTGATLPQAASIVVRRSIGSADQVRRRLKPSSEANGVGCD
jgi:hypothetical protein